MVKWRDKEIERLREVLEWGLNLCYGVSKGGNKPCSEEYEDWASQAEQILKERG